MSSMFSINVIIYLCVARCALLVGKSILRVALQCMKRNATRRQRSSETKERSKKKHKPLINYTPSHCKPARTQCSLPPSRLMAVMHVMRPQSIMAVMSVIDARSIGKQYTHGGEVTTAKVNYYDTNV